MVYAATIPREARLFLDRHDPGSSDAMACESPTSAIPPSVETKWRLPGDARIVLTRDLSPVSAQIRNRRYGHLPEVAVIGPTSRAIQLSSSKSFPIEITIDPLDWSRLTGAPAAAVIDRIVPAADLGITCLDGLGHLPATDLIDAALARLSDAVIDGRTTRSELPGQSLVPALIALIDAGAVFDATTAAERLDIAPHVLRRIALRWFGFPPKTLLMRRRFLAAMAAFRAAGMDFAVIAAFGYFDASHFLRDAGRFLGTTPRRYLRLVDGIA